jgi:hypothetical protein
VFVGLCVRVKALPHLVCQARHDIPALVVHASAALDPPQAVVHIAQVEVADRRVLLTLRDDGDLQVLQGDPSAHRELVEGGGAPRGLALGAGQRAPLLAVVRSLCISRVGWWWYRGE